MDLNEDNLKTAKYKITSFTLKIGTTKHEVENDHISRIIFDRDYDNFYFPYFQVDLSVTSTIHRKMKKYNGKIICNTVIKCAYYKSDKKSDENNPVFSSTELSGKYYVYMDDTSPDLTEASQERAEKENSSTSALIPVKILLYNYDHFKSYNVVINKVLSGVSLVDIVAYLFSRVRLRNVVMSPASSRKSYSQFIITPIKFLDQLQRVCNGYGIHKDGTVIFFDTKYIYVVARNSKCTAFRSGEFKNTYLISSSDESNDSSAVSGSYRSNKYKANVVALNSNSITMKDMNDLISATHGKNSVIIDSSTGKVTTAILDKKSGSVNNVMMMNEGEDTSSAVKNELKESLNQITIGCSGVCLDMFSPNKQFILSIAGKRFKRYNGKYRISRSLATFAKEGDLFNVSMSISLKG